MVALSARTVSASICAKDSGESKLESNRYLSCSASSSASTGSPSFLQIRRSDSYSTELLAVFFLLARRELWWEGGGGG
jgi:hypothetical protein